MTDVERDTVARDDLWNALVIQTRSVLALRDASGQLEKTNFSEPLRNEFDMAAKSGFLSVWLHVEDGEGSWNAISEKLDRAEPWFMSVDGEIRLSGASMDIATAANRFVEMISPE